MKKKEVSNWDLIVKLLDDNESEIHMKRYIFHDGIILYLICKDMPTQMFNLLPKIKDNKTIKENVNEMTVYNFRTFYEEVSESIKRMKDTKVWYEKLIKEYKKEA
jgi:hypothetical protein